jgi:hypothetical protein
MLQVLQPLRVCCLLHQHQLKCFQFHPLMTQVWVLVLIFIVCDGPTWHRIFRYPGSNPKRGSWNHQGASVWLESCCWASRPTSASAQPTIHWPRVDCVSVRCLWPQASNSSELCVRGVCVWLGEELDLRTYCTTVVADGGELNLM